MAVVTDVYYTTNTARNVIWVIQIITGLPVDASGNDPNPFIGYARLILDPVSINEISKYLVVGNVIVIGTLPANQQAIILQYCFNPVAPGFTLYKQP